MTTIEILTHLVAFLAGGIVAYLVFLLISHFFI